jgi:uncharacterized membrane protein YbaN (DUF454 family)
MLRPAQRWFWRVLAVLALAAGVVGIVLPVLPTAPFLIVAAWAASKGSPRLEAWLIGHRIFGPHIRRWRARGAVPRRAKWTATVLMVISLSAMWFAAPLPAWLKAAVTTFVAAVALWLWRRPED